MVPIRSTSSLTARTIAVSLAARVALQRFDLVFVVDGQSEREVLLPIGLGDGERTRRLTSNPRRRRPRAPSKDVQVPEGKLN